MKKHSKKHESANPRRSSSRKKAFLLLIILGVVVMCVYFISLQQFEDETLVEETNPTLNQPGE